MNLYLFFGYAVFWTLIFAYVVFLHRRQREQLEELKSLARSVEE